MFFTYIFYFLVAVLLHEFGHLAAAWSCSVTVREFGIGWGRQLLAFRVARVNCVIRILPIGAYVRLDMSELRGRPLSQQVLVLLAGIIANLVAAAFTGGTRFGLVNYLLAATNILPLYQQDGWKCGMVMLRGGFKRKSSLPEWTFTIAGGVLSLTLMAAAIFRWV
jgi:membrane-associated protease RseP (regulator of RpoE activity)